MATKTRENMIKLLDRPKARKYREVMASSPGGKLSFSMLELAKPGAFEDLDKRRGEDYLLRPTGMHYDMFYDHVLLGPSFEVTRAVAKELIKMGLPKYTTIQGPMQVESTIDLIEEAVRISAEDSRKVEISLAQKTMTEFMAWVSEKDVAEQDKIALWLSSVNISSLAESTCFKKDYSRRANCVISSPSLICELMASCSGSMLRMWSVSDAHRLSNSVSDIVSMAVILFKGSDEAVIAEGIRRYIERDIESHSVDLTLRRRNGPIYAKSALLSTTLDEATYDGDSNNAGWHVKLSDNMRNGILSHGPKREAAEAIRKAVRVMRLLSKMTVTSKFRGDMPEYFVKAHFPANLYLSTELDSTSVPMTEADISELIDISTSFSMSTFYPALPNEGRFHDPKVTTPVALDIMALEQVKNPETLGVSKKIVLDGVTLENVVGKSAQERLQKFITTCLVGPPVSSIEEAIWSNEDPTIRRGDKDTIELFATFSESPNNKITNYNYSFHLHLVSGAKVTYENFKPIMQAIEDIEAFVDKITNSSSSAGYVLEPNETRLSGVRRAAKDILLNNLMITEKAADMIAELCARTPGCDSMSLFPPLSGTDPSLRFGPGPSPSGFSLDFAARSALAAYMACAAVSAKILVTIPDSSSVSNLLIKRLKKFIDLKQAKKDGESDADYKRRRLGHPASRSEDLEDNGYVSPGLLWKVDPQLRFADNESRQDVFSMLRRDRLDSNPQNPDGTFVEKAVAIIDDENLQSAYRSLPCVGYDSDGNYVFKIKEFGELCNELSDIDTNFGSTGSANDRAAIHISPFAFSDLSVHMRAALKASYFKFVEREKERAANAAAAEALRLAKEKADKAAAIGEEEKLATTAESS